MKLIDEMQVPKTDKFLFCLKSISVVMLVFFGFAVAYTALAQTLKHPLSEISTNKKMYKYIHKLNATQQKEIRYLILRSAGGNIKTCFDACDVCYTANKGYTQVGLDLRCNNCGKTFKIEDLGTQSAGGCWPGLLLNKVENDSVSVTVADVVKGAYYFPPMPITSVENEDLQSSAQIKQTEKKLIVSFSDARQRNNSIYSADGKLCNKNVSQQIETSFDTFSLPSGVYFLVSEDSGKFFTKSFVITK